LSTADLLTRTLAALEAGHPLPPEAADWLAGGLRSYLEEGGRLERRLGIPEGQLRRELRDLYLREAGELVAINGAGPWERANRLAEQIQRFGSRTWPRVRALAHPPEHFGPIDTALFWAFTYREPPATARQLFTLLTAEA
jgi:hypothetical protein